MYLIFMSMVRLTRCCLFNIQKSYDQFVKSVDKDFTVSFSDKEEAILEFISSLVNGKRIHELLMISSLLNNEKISLGNLQNTSRRKR